KSLLKTEKSIATAVGILFLDVFTLFFFILLGEHFWMGWPVFGSSLAAIGVLIYLAHRVPADALRSKGETPTRSPLKIGILGALFYPSILCAKFLGMGAKLPAFIVTVLTVGVQALYLIYVLRIIGRSYNERNLIALAAGLVTPLAVFGLVSQISLPLVLIVDIALIAFFRKLWTMYGKKNPLGPIEESRSNGSNSFNYFS
ncbi:MAG: hypothetical protein OK439_07420, partial [Thaumarchaeota archaeon]|nr:hypothetical protein [Nitrososphaerota archaeon]